MRFAVDRIEGEFAVCEDSEGATINIDLKKLPPDVKSGDILVFRDGRFLNDKTAMSERRAEISALQEKLLGKSTD
ncbi:DUF3006 domain-containing protein [Ruminococcus albus]|uniref:Uncharacterized protein n=1 Tax=Ruminococcus albus TaxID=1264 RepID=A0A1H7F4G8_RUMAL|nr:DUF3006 domain-containing protein [Ruminococcus albus]SEK19192.1 Protein of unknown function [Ruminococcus albus]